MWKENRCNVLRKTRDVSIRKNKTNIFNELKIRIIYLFNEVIHDIHGQKILPGWQNPAVPYSETHLSLDPQAGLPCKPFLVSQPCHAFSFPPSTPNNE